MLEQSLEMEIKVGERDLAKAKNGIALSEEKKATAEGDLEVTTKDLKGAVQNLADLKHDCMTASQDFEAEVNSRGEELKAIAKAKEIIKETTSGAEKEAYDLEQVSFVQLGSTRLASHTDLAHFEAVRFVRDLAQKQKSL